MRYLPNTNTLCLEYSEFVRDGICSEANYPKLRQRKSIKVHGRGGNGNGVLVEYDSLPVKMKELVDRVYGNVYQYYSSQPILRMVKPDAQAREWYRTYELADGRTLPIEAQEEYCRKASWLNMMLWQLEDKQSLKQVLKISIDIWWQYVIRLHQCDSPVNPNLPTSYDALRKLLKKYQDEGYGGLVSKKYGNQNTRKVSGDVERLLVSLYCAPSKPHYSEVCRMYMDFVTGKMKVVDVETGEVFDPEEFKVNGEVKLLEVGSVKNYLQKPLNEILIGQYRQSSLEHRSMNLPSNHRLPPVWALSKLTMDDTSSPFKMLDNTRPATYKIFDVMSGALVAMAIHKKPNADVALIREAIAKLYALIVANGWKNPGEMEVERHLTNNLKGNRDRQGKAGDRDRYDNGEVLDVLTAGVVFEYVTECAAQNPQEKMAEGFINRYKYDLQKQRHGFQARIFAKGEAKRANKDSDSHKARFTYEEIEAMEYEDMATWNSSLHPDQKRFAGLTRWQVLEQYQNPKLTLPDLPRVMQYVGYPTETSVRRYRVQVQNNLYNLPDPAVLNRLKSDKVVAYWLPNEEGDAPKNVWVYQEGVFVCEARAIERFNQAKVEQTDEDLRILGEQSRYKKGLLEHVAMANTNIAKTAMMRSDVVTASSSGEVMTVEVDEYEEQGKHAYEVPAKASKRTVASNARQRALDDI